MVLPAILHGVIIGFVTGYANNALIVLIKGDQSLEIIKSNLQCKGCIVGINNCIEQ